MGNPRVLTIVATLVVLAPAYARGQCSEGLWTLTVNNANATCSGSNSNENIFDAKDWTVWAKTSCSASGWKQNTYPSETLRASGTGQCGNATAGTRPVCAAHFQGPYSAGFDPNVNEHKIQVAVTDPAWGGSGCTVPPVLFYTEGVISQECNGYFCCGSGVADECRSQQGEFNQGGCQCDLQPSPIIIDVDGDGYDLSDLGGGVRFDLTADGTREQISWTRAGSDDAFLALDRNGNGTIDDGAELFGNSTPQSISIGRNGFAALKVFEGMSR